MKLRRWKDSSTMTRHSLSFIELPLKRSDGKEQWQIMDTRAGASARSKHCHTHAKEAATGWKIFQRISDCILTSLFLIMSWSSPFLPNFKYSVHGRWNHWIVIKSLLWNPSLFLISKKSEHLSMYSHYFQSTVSQKSKALAHWQND